MKSSAVAAVASDLGCGDGHTPASVENPGERDLFNDFEAETELFADAAVPAKRRPGRPLGSVSRTTKQMQLLLRQKGYRDPAEFLAALYTADTNALAKTLDCDAVEALKVQRQAASELMPYFHSKTPVQIDHQGDGVRPLIMIMPGEWGTRITTNGEAMSIHDVVENQPLSEPAPDRSHESGSHEND